MDLSGKSRREQKEEISRRLGYAKNPNLMLNIGLRRHPQWLLVSTAVFGTLLQVSVLGFAGWVTFVKKLQKEDAMSPSWALSMTVIGTSSLCAGMFMCSSLIERSTKECTFSRSNLSNDTSSSSSHISDEETGIHNEGPGGHSTDTAQTNGSVDRKPRTTFYWVQPGDQVIGDQTFDSFAYSDKAMPLPSYTISWRGPSSPWERRMTWLASMLTIIAFIVQFIGLRGLHSSVQVYQLAVVLIMSALRALLRTKRLDPSDSLFNITENLGNMDKNMSEDINMTINLRGHKLDLLDFDIYRDRSGGNVLATGSGHLNNTWILKCSDANNGETKEQHLTHEGLERIPGTSLWRPKDSNEHRLWPWEEKDTSISTAVWCYRARLGQLTSNTSKETLSQAWPDSLVKGRSESRDAAQAISAAASMIIPVSRTQGRQIYLDFSCLSVASDSNSYDAITESRPNNLLIQLPDNRRVGEESRSSWSVNLADIEAAISLTHYTCCLHQRLIYSHLNDLASHQPSNVRRIIAASVGRNKEAVKKMVAHIELWAEFSNNRLDQIEYITAENVNPASGIATFWTESFKNSETYSPILGSTTDLRSIKQFCGWSAIPQGSTSSESTYVLATYKTTQSLMSLCAQEILAAFLHQLVASEDKKWLEDTKYAHKDEGIGMHNPKVTRLIDSFTENGLGSRADAMLCILLTLAGVRFTNHVPRILDDMLYSVETMVCKGTMTRDEMSALLWGKRCMALGPTEEQIWRWFLISSWYCHKFAVSPRWISDLDCVDLKRTSTTLSTSEKRTNRIVCLVERLNILVGTAEPVLLERDEEYGDLYVCKISDCLQDDDPYGALILAHKVISKRGKVDLETVDELGRQHGPLWKLVTREILARRNIFSICDSEGRDAFCRACVIEDVETAKRLSPYGRKDLPMATDNNGWSIVHHMIAGNRTMLIDLMSFGFLEYKESLNPSKSLFEALGADGVKLDIMIPYLQAEFGEPYKAALDEHKDYTDQMGGGKWIQSDKAWIRGLRRVYDYQQKSEASDLAATKNERGINSVVPNGVWFDNQPTAGNGINCTTKESHNYFKSMTGLSA
jgi:hypothetical protein